MRPVLAAPRAACWFSLCCCVVMSVVARVRAADAQTWNDPRSRALVERATQRRAQQLADTGLTDYQATAHGYVTFLAQLGEGFPAPPKIIKADELELEVYWHAPNLSKQRIIGRRDTLLLPTDIAYHSDHLGIVQNNFPSIIRIGDGDEVRDVPHPLSPLGVNDYDFALADSFAIGSGAQRVNVYEIKVRPKNDQQPRVVGAVYIDPSEGQVVRMSLSFTRAAFLDQSLEELSVVLENRLVGGQYWLPSRQEIEIRRTGTWLDYPVRGIIRGRWEIGEYKFNTHVSTALFRGLEIEQAPPAELGRYPWKGALLDSLPPDVRAATEEDVKRVQAEARALVRAQALARAQQVTLSARNVSDFARVDRVEGFAVGDGLTKQFGSGFSATVRGRYGLDDRDGKGTADVAWQSGNGFRVRVFGIRDFRDVGDVAERSGVVNSIAAQEFGSDYTDPYLVRGGGAALDFTQASGLRWTLEGSYENQSALTVHATPVTGVYEPVVPVLGEKAVRLSARVDRPESDWIFGTQFSGYLEVRALLPQKINTDLMPLRNFNATRASVAVDIERSFPQSQRLVLQTTGALLHENAGVFGAPQDAVYFGGPVSAPGYAYHSIVSDAGIAQRVEWRMPVPFPAFSLGRFGRVPGQGTLAPYAHVAAMGDLGQCLPPPPSGVSTGDVSIGCPIRFGGLFPSLGAGFLTPFDLIRIDVAKGVARGGRWFFYVDVSRDFWSVL